MVVVGRTIEGRSSLRPSSLSLSGLLALGALAMGLLLPAQAGAAVSQAKLEKIIRSKPNHIKARWLLGRLYFKKKRYIDAAKTWIPVTKRRPKLVKVKYLTGLALYKAKRHDLAARYWQSALCADPGHGQSRDGLVLLARKGVIEQQEIGPGRSCRRAKPKPDPVPEPGPVETGPADPAPPEPGPSPSMNPDMLAAIQVQKNGAKATEAWEQGKRMRKLGKREQAIEHFKEAFRYGHDKMDVDYYLGKTLLENEQVKPALFHLERAMAVNGEDQEIHLNIGKAHSLDGDTEKEIASYQRALQLDPEYGEAHFMLALAYDKVDNSPKVLEHAQKAIRIDPEYKEKLKPRIKDSNVSKKIGTIVTRVLEDSKYERLTDEKIEEYAEEIGRILGEENLNADEFMGGQGGGNARDQMRGVLTDIREGRGKDALKRIPAKNRGKFLTIIKKNKGKFKGLEGKIKSSLR